MKASRRHFAVFQGAAQTLNEDAVHESAFAMHANTNAMFLQYASKGIACALGALIGIEHFRRAMSAHGAV